MQARNRLRQSGVRSSSKMFALKLDGIRWKLFECDDCERRVLLGHDSAARYNPIDDPTFLSQLVQFLFKSIGGGSAITRLISKKAEWF